MVDISLSPDGFTKFHTFSIFAKITFLRALQNEVITTLPTPNREVVPSVISGILFACFLTLKCISKGESFLFMMS